VKPFGPNDAMTVSSWVWKLSWQGPGPGEQVRVGQSSLQALWNRSLTIKPFLLYVLRESSTEIPELRPSPTHSAVHSWSHLWGIFRDTYGNSSLGKLLWRPSSPPLLTQQTHPQTRSATASPLPRVLSDLPRGRAEGSAGFYGRTAEMPPAFLPTERSKPCTAWCMGCLTFLLCLKWK